MLDRYTITSDLQQLKDRFSVDVPAHYKSRHNAGPSQLLPVITSGSKGISFFYWGISPEWSKNKTISEKIINIRAEQILEKPVFRKKLVRFRCIVPCDGFYLWKKISKRSSVPYRFVLKSKKLFSLAALWEEYEDTKGENFHTFSIITLKAVPAVEPIHERMPLLFDKDMETIWLNPGVTESELNRLMQAGNPAELEFYTVSPRISVLEKDEPSMSQPSAPADQHGNLTLFD